jgi:hypothetical protein
MCCNAHTHYTRFASDAYWEMTLRGFGERYAAVGNIFSGLFCSVSDKPSAFKVYTTTITTATVTVTCCAILPLCATYLKFALPASSL